MRLPGILINERKNPESTTLKEQDNDDSFSGKLYVGSMVSSITARNTEED